MPAAGEAAIERDKAWFRANPDRTRLQRRVRRRELPASLRALGIAEVLIERVDARRFVRTWLDHQGRPVASGMDMYHAPVVPDAPDGSISLQRQGEGVRCLVDKGTAADDRAWFEQHPGETVRVRSMTAEEMVSAKTPPGFVVTGGEVTVTKIADGVRTRLVEYAVAPAESVQ